jgi:hypothetical protein
MLSNNIVAYNDYGVYKASIATIPTFSHNDVYRNASGDYFSYTPPSGQGNIGLDPLFVDSANLDYRLRSGSACIDAGDNSGVTVGEVDLAGNPRRIDDPATPDTGAGVAPVVDIGAFEYVTGVQPFNMAGTIKALQAAGGLSEATDYDTSRLDVNGDGSLTVLDAVRIARKVAGLDPNP